MQGICRDYKSLRGFVATAVGTRLLRIGSPLSYPQKRLSPAKAGLECLIQVLAEVGAVSAIVAISSEGV